MATYDLAIVGGTLVSPGGTKQSSVGILDGKIAAVVDPGIPLDASSTIDASGKHIFPGVIDPHVHMKALNQTFGETLQRETRSLITGGVTTALIFIEAPNASYEPVLAERVAAIPQSGYTDVGFHPIIMGLDHVREFPTLARKWGVSSAKMYFAANGRELYPGTIAVDDGTLWSAMGMLAALGSPAIAMVHAENWEIASAITQELQAAGRKDPAAWTESKPNPLEEECMKRAAYFAEQQNCPLYVVHISTAQGPQVIIDARARSVQMYGETCPHYLMIHAHHEKAAMAKYNPAIKWEDDNAALWEALASGKLQCVGSDHIPVRWPDKSKGGFDDIWTARGGVPGSATIFPLMLSEGVNKGRLSLEQVAAVTSANAARIFGLSDRKGTIAAGFDADLVIADLNKRVTVRPELLQLDFTLFDGQEFTGWPETTVLGGVPVVVNGEVTGKPGQGKYLRRYNASNG